MKSSTRSFHLKSRFSRLFCCVFVALTLLVWPFSVLAEEANTAAAPFELTIEQPSGIPDTIAPGRNIYVLGSFTGDSSAVTSLEVTLTDSKGLIVRKVSTQNKADKNLNVNYSKLGFGYNDNPSYRENFLNSGMPDLIVEDLNNPNATMDKASIKCYFDDTNFSALLAGGINPTLKNMDVTSAGLDLKDENGNSFNSLEDGENYTITVKALDKDNNTLQSKTDTITIGYTSDKLLSRFSPNSHMTAAQDFANSIGAAVYLDLFPGYWDSKDYFGEIKPEWQLGDAAEYVSGKVHCILYNISKSSSSYSVELGTLEKLGVIDDINRFVPYYYNIGEPQLGDIQGEIIPMDENDKLALARVDIQKNATKENEFIPYSYDPSITKSDINLSDGVVAEAGDTLSFYGVAAPIQLKDDEIKKSETDNSYQLNNKISTLQYHITGDGIDQTLENKKIELVRYYTESDYANGWGSTSEMEFKHNLTIDGSMAGKTLNINISGYDAYGQPVEGTEETVTVMVEKTVSPSDNLPQSVTPANPVNPKTSTDNAASPVLPFTLLAAVLTGTAAFARKRAS